MWRHRASMKQSYLSNWVIIFRMCLLLKYSMFKHQFIFFPFLKKNYRRQPDKESRHLLSTSYAPASVAGAFMVLPLTPTTPGLQTVWTHPEVAGCWLHSWPAVEPGSQLCIACYSAHAHHTPPGRLPKQKCCFYWVWPHAKIKICYFPSGD